MFQPSLGAWSREMLHGGPPCKVADLQFQNQFKMLRSKPVANAQLLICIDDTGDERGVMETDNDLLRVKRKALCCLSGKPVVVCRTGDVKSMNKYLRWEKDTIIFVVARILDSINGVPHLAIKGSKRFADAAAAQVFNTYFKRYCELAANVEGQTPLAMDNSWTPKRRRQELSDDGDSQSSLTPLVY